MSEDLFSPFFHTAGPKTAKVLAIGEAWGEQEELTGFPFMGTTGQELNRLLGEAGLRRQDLLLTNTLCLRPPSNNIELVCVDKSTLEGLIKTTPDLSPQAAAQLRRPLRQGKYFPPALYPHFQRLYEEVKQTAPNLILALGNTACWAILGMTRIGSIRGAVTQATYGIPGTKVLPTYHPSAVMRNWPLRPIVLADLMKAAREQNFPEIRRPERTILVNPSLGDIVEWSHRDAWAYAVDIETKGSPRQITMISFARSPKDSIVIPFYDESRPGWSYWTTHTEEVQAWELVRALLLSRQPKIFQNGLYDLQFLIKMGFKVNNCLHDTMLLHHSHFPELLKGLGFLGSIYTNEAAWKLMREDESNKKDE